MAAELCKLFRHQEATRSVARDAADLCIGGQEDGHALGVSRSGGGVQRRAAGRKGAMWARVGGEQQRGALDVTKLTRYVQRGAAARGSWLVDGGARGEQ